MDTRPLDDAQLIQAAIAEDGPARAALLDDIRVEVSDRFAKSIPASFQATISAEDIASATVVALLEQLAKGRIEFRSVGEFRALVKMVARSRLFDQLRRSQPTQEVRQTSSANLLQDLQIDAETASQVAQHSEQVSQISSVIATLPEHEQILFALFYERGLKQAQIAELLDLKPAGVNSRLCRLREKVGNQLRTHPDFKSFYRQEN